VSGVLDIEPVGDDRLRVSGRVDVANARDAMKRGRMAAKPGVRMHVDVGALASADSVTLAVLLEWAAHARRRGGAFIFDAVPHRLRAIAHLSDVEDLMGLPA